MRKWLIRGLALAVVLGLAWGGYAIFNALPKRVDQFPTTKVKFGDVAIRAYTRGELRAARSTTLVAPNLFSTVQVTRIAPMGSFAHEKDLIVEFDDSERRAQLEETMLEVDQTDEQIKQLEADLAIRNNQDQVDLLRARFAVRRAELDVKQNPLLPEIDQKKNILALDETKRRLLQLESDVKSRQEQAQAQIETYKEQRRKSLLDVAREKQRIAQSKMLAPMSGLVAVRQNRTTDFYYPGMQLPDIHEGDTLRAGIPVADILDLSELEVLARVGELDRANLHEGQEASITLDAIPDQKFRATIKSMSGMASSNVFSGDPAKKFDVVFGIDMQQLMTALGAKPDQIRQVLETAARNAAKSSRPEPVKDAAKKEAPKAEPAKGSPSKAGREDPLAQFAKATNIFGSDEERARAKLPPAPEEDSQLSVLLRPGLLADVEILVEKIPNATFIPNQAVLEKDGRQFVYVQQKSGFEPRNIKISRRSEAFTVVAGSLKIGEVVALGDPFAKKTENGSKKSSGAPMGGMGGGAK